ncbi:G-patch domain-containing protein [Mycena chlorophos]|uniref:G-patch domain-containing protein n=1 Tax=Mycena chlorophos TaxID=658473 RepID=A0A8H6W034_MYCCL|nr:G-patch domain-containing protein [Mycena chlorophos]
MGLSGRKTKQRIGSDPRNLAWADDAAKFGAAYLSKFGWDASKGLGAEGDGRLSHIKVSQKLDMLGIGAAQQRDPNGIAWKQNRDFERVLERLNAAAGQEQPPAPSAPEGFTKASNPVDEVVAAVDAVKPVVPRHRAHRARAIAAKNIASKSAAAISEILGVASSSATPSTSATPQGTLTPLNDEPAVELITTSKTSVADYFKDKLLAKSSKPAATLSEEDEAPRGGIGASRGFSAKAESDGYDAMPRVGLGGGSSKLSSLMASAFSSAAAAPTANIDEPMDDAPTEESGKRKKKKDKKGKGRESDAEGEATEKTKEKEKKSKRRRDEDEEEVQPEKKKSKRPRDEDGESKAERKKKKKRTEAEVETPAEATEDGGDAETISREERKRAKKEKKRLKQLQS